MINLDLSQNFITSTVLDGQIFSSLVNLVSLNISNNKLDRINNSFFNQANLKILDLFTNYISLIERDSFASLISLKILTLFGNSYFQVDQTTFTGLNNLTELYMGVENLLNININTFDGLNSLRNVYFIYQLSGDATLTSDQQDQILSYQANFSKIKFEANKFNSISLQYLIYFKILF